MGNAPLSFGCTKCRRDWDRNYRRGESYLNRGTIIDVVLTGRVRYTSVNSPYSTNVQTKYEYRCTWCDHVGWSTHRDIADKADRDGIAPHEKDERGQARFAATQTGQQEPSP